MRGGSDGNQAVPAVWIAEPGDGIVEVTTLASADWQAPTAPQEPFTDVLRYDGSSWGAELTSGAVWFATEQHGVYRLGASRCTETPCAGDTMRPSPLIRDAAHRG